ncbi:hypothetical protein [Rhizobium mongolense]
MKVRRTGWWDAPGTLIFDQVGCDTGHVPFSSGVVRWLNADMPVTAL